MCCETSSGSCFPTKYSQISILNSLPGVDRFPWDKEAKTAIDIEVALHDNCADEEYLQSLDSALTKAFDRFSPQLVIHNAGSDILVGDPLGMYVPQASCFPLASSQNCVGFLWTAVASNKLTQCVLIQDPHHYPTASTRLVAGLRHATNVNPSLYWADQSAAPPWFYRYSLL